MQAGPSSAANDAVLPDKAKSSSNVAKLPAPGKRKGAGVGTCSTDKPTSKKKSQKKVLEDSDADSIADPSV